MNEVLEKILKTKDDHITLLEAIQSVIEKHNLDIVEVASLIKKDKTFLSILKFECEKNGLLKNKKVEKNLESLLLEA